MSKSEERPQAQVLRCGNCKFEFFSVSPTHSYNKPSPEKNDHSESLETQTQCLICKRFNVIYWYMGFPSS